MAIGHIAVRPHSRSQGHSMAAAVAYRCGLALTCERTGERHDFTRRAQRADVAEYGLTGGRFGSIGAFATAVEAAEKRRNSRICRDVQMALPAELDEHSRIELSRAFAAELAERYGTAACWAVHRPDRRSDQRNHHAHILLPTRALNDDGRSFGKKLRVLDDQRRGPEEITEIRQLWEARANKALIAAGQEATVHTGRTANPEPTLGTTHTAIERNAWKLRHARQRQRPMSAAQLVVDDGVCVTGRGRALAQHVRDRHVALRAAKRYFVGEDTPSRPSPALAPVAAQDLASAVVALEPEPEPCPVRPPASVAAPRFASAVVALEPEPEPCPARVSGLHSILKRLEALRKRKDELQRDLEAARVWLTRTVGSSRHGTSLPVAADSIARQRLTAEVSLPEFHPQRYAGRPDLPRAISLLAPRAAPGYQGNPFGSIPDSWNTGACRTQAGAERAAKVLDDAIDGIARKHFKGHTDPRDYKPGLLRRSIEKAKDAALTAWRNIRELVIERMVSAAEGPEADEIGRRRIEQERERIRRKTEERKRLARERDARSETAREQQEAQSRTSPKPYQGPGFGY